VNFRILLLLPFVCVALLFAEPRGYTPIIQNDLNTSAYDWNAVNTRWVNMRAIAMIGLDAAHFYQDEASIAQVGDMSRYDRWDVRGLRIGAAGTINFDHPWTYLLSGSINSAMQDYDKSTDHAFTLLDAVVGIPLWGDYGRMQIGKMKEPISMERVMGMVFEQVMERPMHLDALLLSRNTGISFSDLILDQRLRWRVGVYNAWLNPDKPGFKKANYAYTGRITGVLYEDKEAQNLLHLGGSYRYEKVREGTIRYDVGPEFYFSSPWLDTGEIPADHTQTYNLEFSWLYGPLWLASEYTRTQVDSPLYGSLDFAGWHVALNYFLTGEHRGYDKQRGIVRRITPVLDFDKGGWGALEASFRYSTLNLNDKAVRGGEMDVYSAGLIWHPRRDHQFHIQWSHARPRLDRTTPRVSDTHILQVRWVWVID
jgi:phosphate-selective porin OprO/OprP